MSRVQDLKSARDNLSVKFLQFTRIVSKNKYAIFFEGEDEKYYSSRISSLRPDIGWIGVNTGGKAKVMEMRDKIRQHRMYRSAPCLFFVDADFDDNSDIVELHDVYVTPCYSVENLYVGLNAFLRVLAAEFGVNHVTDEQSYELTVEIYNNLIDEFLVAIKPFNCLVRELRILEKNNETPGKLNINNINFDNLISFGVEGVRKKYDETDPRSIFPDLMHNPNLNLENSSTYFENLSGIHWFRGKQNIEFFRLLIDKLKQDRCSRKERRIFKERGNVKLQLSKSNCISELSQYADTPECLREFLLNQPVIAC